MNNEETKKGRGKPPGSLKENAMRSTLKLRLSDGDLANAHRVADLLGEDISEFVRVAIRQRCKKASYDIVRTNLAGKVGKRKITPEQQAKMQAAKGHIIP